jgi:pimeloyl-ACP methyl ester carboxylesterase
VPTLKPHRSGSSAGIPVLYLHGGPGASPGQGYRTRHDASRFWTIGLHQRGCGQSTPTVQDDLGSLPATTGSSAAGKSSRKGSTSSTEFPAISFMAGET